MLRCKDKVSRRQNDLEKVLCFYNHGYTIMKIFDVLPDFPFTTRETKPDY